MYANQDDTSYSYILVSVVLGTICHLFLDFFNISGATQYTHNVEKKIVASTRQQSGFSTCI
jgi:membrane-bound metal-dependent hydrolase YbcI (DUF457 family)